MRKNFGVKTYVYPQPVFMIGSYGEDGKPDLMNAAWGGISEENEISLCLSAGHKTVKNILSRGALTISMATADYAAACDYVGIESGNKVPDKFEKAGFHAVRSEFVDAPVVEELPLCIECRLKSYDPESCRMVAQIVNVSADESVLDDKGLIDPEKLRPIVFDAVHNTYRELGPVVARAFSAGLAIKKG